MASHGHFWPSSHANGAEQVDSPTKRLGNSDRMQLRLIVSPHNPKMRVTMSAKIKFATLAVLMTALSLHGTAFAQSSGNLSVASNHRLNV
jgi:hypothetical protein